MATGIIAAQTVRLTILSVLPIELISFEVRRENKFVHLDWKTTYEHNNAFFRIERNSEERQWQEIGKIDSKRNSTSIVQYSFIDKKTLVGHNYYRLRQLDNDGSFTYLE